MDTHKEIYWAITRHRQPRMLAVLTEAKALGIKLDCDWESAMHHCVIDAADTLGCRRQDIDITRSHHLDLLSAAFSQMIQEQIDAAPGGTDSSASSYLKKAP